MPNNYDIRIYGEYILNIANFGISLSTPKIGLYQK